MWKGFFRRRNFYTKCKSALKMIKVRMELIMKKRTAMQKYLKSDIADLLKNNLDYNAYTRVDCLFIELNLSSCYDYVQECCELVSDNLKLMHKERECLQECKVMVASLTHAASRFADLLELRNLRAMFTKKYGNELELYVSQEFIEKLKLNPPTMEMKIQLMKDIAKEFAITWEPTFLEQELNNYNPQHHMHIQGYKLCRAISDDNVLSRKEASDGEKVVLGPLKPTFDDMTRASPKSVRSRFHGRLVTHEDRKDESNYEEDIKDVNVKLLEEDGKCEEEDVMDRVLKHYNMKPWREMNTNRTTSVWPSIDKDKELELEIEIQGCTIYNCSRSTSPYENHMHHKLPNYDELASRVKSLKNM